MALNGSLTKEVAVLFFYAVRFDNLFALPNL